MPGLKFLLTLLHIVRIMVVRVVSSSPGKTSDVPHEWFVMRSVAMVEIPAAVTEVVEAA